MNLVNPFGILHCCYHFTKYFPFNAGRWLPPTLWLAAPRPVLPDAVHGVLRPADTIRGTAPPTTCGALPPRTAFGSHQLPLHAFDVQRCSFYSPAHASTVASSNDSDKKSSGKERKAATTSLPWGASGLNRGGGSTLLALKMPNLSVFLRSPPMTGQNV